MLAILLIISVVDAKNCPDKCICNTGKDGTRSFKDKMYGERGYGSTCTACLPAYEGDWWGDRCEEPCGDFRTLDMAGRDDAERYGLGNCDGCTFKGECKSCIEGHWGGKCQKECPKNCRNTKTGAWECNEWGGCFGCKVGFCGFLGNGEEGGCETPCSPTCRNPNVCSPGSCKCDGCALGYHGGTCGKKCKEGCKQCKQSSGACTDCMDNHWAKGGSTRNCQPCPENCKGDTCNKEGKCDACKDGFHGELCDQKCPENCDNGKCKQDGQCECKPGTFGKDCAGSCPEGCESDDCSDIGECDCKENFYGLKCDGAFCEGECDKPCPEHCAEQCDREDGTCNDKCEHGWWGVKCEHKCPDNCKGGGCGVDGTCDLGCEDGHWSHTCEEECDAGCQYGKCQQLDGWCECEGGKWGAAEFLDNKRTPSCTESCSDCLDPALKSDVVCNQNTGRCSDCPGLRAKGVGARYGPMCELSCPVNCDDHCDRETGICRCSSGFWGVKCEECPKACPDACDDEGHCVDACPRGLWGPTCAEHCSPHCHADLCDKESAECIRGCETGWYDLTCKTECPPNTAEHMGCDIETGHSVACKTGFWGDTCEAECPSHCESGCDKAKGECSSCLGQKWYGKKCETQCPTDCLNGQCDMAGKCFACEQDEQKNSLRWGKQCETACAPNCVDGCDPGDGKCNKCKKGFWKANAVSQECTEECDVQCGECNGPSRSDCTSCDFAASLKKEGKASTCECVHFAERWKSATQLILGHTLRTAGKCTCEWNEENAISQKFLFGAGRGSSRYCSPGSPRGTIEANGVVYPTRILWAPKGGWPQGRCTEGSMEIGTIGKPFCVHMIAAVEMYNSKRVGSTIEPTAKSWDASRLCSIWKDVSDEECQKGDAGANTRTRDGDVKCGLLVDSFCMPTEDWEHTVGEHQIREDSLLESHVVRRAI